ncbi:uncharacterized protein BDV14DRAFT_197434 [Aspergillus stella-maris]|uniref:uncharacterized protein n=1 Tax=Aspergillus stella-maris TaxID=1810926 RepID=UPI003CCE2003
MKLLIILHSFTSLLGVSASILPKINKENTNNALLERQAQPIATCDKYTAGLCSCFCTYGQYAYYRCIPGQCQCYMDYTPGCYYAYEYYANGGYPAPHDWSAVTYPSCPDYPWCSERAHEPHESPTYSSGSGSEHTATDSSSYPTSSDHATTTTSYHSSPSDYASTTSSEYPSSTATAHEGSSSAYNSGSQSGSSYAPPSASDHPTAGGSASYAI